MEGTGKLFAASSLVLVIVGLAVYLSMGATIVTYGAKWHTFPHSTKECYALGGAWVHLGAGQSYCDLATMDAGRLCASAADCQGGCFADNQTSKEGRCSAKLMVYGCHVEVERAGSVRICRD